MCGYWVAEITRYPARAAEDGVNVIPIYIILLYILYISLPALMNRSVIWAGEMWVHTRVYIYMAKYIMGTALPQGGYTRVSAVYSYYKDNNDCAETHGEKKSRYR